jgi:hypothetical protein
MSAQPDARKICRSPAESYFRTGQDPGSGIRRLGSCRFGHLAGLLDQDDGQAAVAAQRWLTIRAAAQPTAADFTHNSPR